MIDGQPDGPAWLGIGAQRSGTTWFSDLLVQHPEVTFGRSGRKELHTFNSALVDGSGSPERQYGHEFRGLRGKPGEFTPAYLRMLWVPEAARAACHPDVVLIVLLRDPVERFASAMRLFLRDQRPRRKGVLSDWARDKGIDATWAGMYATHLDAWLQVFERERLVVLQYECIREDPHAAVTRVWSALGLEAHRLEGVGRASRTSVPRSAWSLDAVSGLRERLVRLYRPEVDRLAAEWGIDPSYWPNFA